MLSWSLWIADVLLHCICSTGSNEQLICCAEVHTEDFHLGDIHLELILFNKVLRVVHMSNMWIITVVSFITLLTDKNNNGIFPLIREFYLHLVRLWHAVLPHDWINLVGMRSLLENLYPLNFLVVVSEPSWIVCIASITQFYI
jgi:hypothetical protein